MGRRVRRLYRKRQQQLAALAQERPCLLNGLGGGGMHLTGAGEDLLTGRLA